MSRQRSNLRDQMASSDGLGEADDVLADLVVVSAATTDGVDGVADVLVVGDRIAVVAVFVRAERLPFRPIASISLWVYLLALRRISLRCRSALTSSSSASQSFDRLPVPSWLPMPANGYGTSWVPSGPPRSGCKSSGASSNSTEVVGLAANETTDRPAARQSA